ncbi:MAG: DUF2934 domain-containing protein [Candidatus Didemnitutus sp.]|nr:DUF2934 domain-containing protein [Candidatus Didemnitutus sp.]
MKTIPSVLVRPLRLASGSRRDISSRASAIWRHAGRPVGQDVSIWLQAEQEIVALNWRGERARALRLAGRGFARSDRYASVTAL